MNRNSMPSLFKVSSKPVYSGPATESPEGTDCPYSTAVMAAYFFDCHEKYSKADYPNELIKFELRQKLYFLTRQFWVWSAWDLYDQRWDIVVGSGETPTFGKSGKEIWMTADLYAENWSPKEIVLDEYPDHIGETGKPNS